MTEITGRTAILLMLAHPVAHVRGSALINRRLAELGHDAAISPLHVLPGDLPAVVAALRLMRNVAGFGVTIPHKIAMADLVDGLTPAARRVGAVNFVRREADGRLTGHNVDGAGFLGGLAARGFDPRGRSALVVGSGGVGRAIAFALAEAGTARLRLANRSPERAAALAADIAAALPGVDVAACDAGDPAQYPGLDLLVNATSLGMWPGEPLPAPADHLSPATTVAEVVIHPALTPLLAAAQARGCPVIGGSAMLAPQPDLVAEFFDLERWSAE